jgi:hypothetical protein
LNKPPNISEASVPIINVDVKVTILIYLPPTLKVVEALFVACVWRVTIFIFYPPLTSDIDNVKMSRYAIQAPRGRGE